MPDRIARSQSSRARVRSSRRLASAVALALAAGAGSAAAAGLGRLTVQSALGQPLRAEVEITSVSRDEATNLAARLASVDAFRQAGLEFGPALQGLRFAVEPRGEGRHVVRISSAQPINEPFVDLLLELNWANGRLVREYTFLLDPPELRSLQASSGGIAAQEPIVPPQTVIASRALRADPARAAGAGSAARAAERRTDDGARTSVGDAAAGDVYQVNRGDTLAGIARKVKPASARAEQTAAAIYRTNPAAFVGSPDILKAGSSLRIPDATVIASIDPAEAQRTLGMRLKDASADRGPVAEGGDQLKLSREAMPGAAVSAAGSATARASAVEQGVARDAAIAQVDERVRQLERTLLDLQKLLELKDRSLASAQKQIDDARLPGGKPAGEQAGKIEFGAARAANAADAAAGAIPAAAMLPAAAGSGAVPSTSAPVAQPVAAVAATGAPAAPTSPQPAVEPSLLDDLMSSPYALPGLGGVALLAAGYAWLAVRRRRRTEQFEDSLTMSDALVANSMFGTAGPTDEAGTLAGSNSAQPASIEEPATEVDPVAEAEVYIAYGREPQAEEILREALRRQPDRQPVRMKLLEIYAGRKDAVAFGEIAGEIYMATQGSHQDWPRIAAWGRELEPDNPVYASDDGAAAARTAGSAQQSGQQAFAAGQSSAAGTATSAAAAAATPPSAGFEEDIAPLDFELDLEAAIGGAGERLTDERPDGFEAVQRTSAGAAGTSELSRALGADFELPSLDLEPAPARAAAMPSLDFAAPGSTGSPADAKLAMDAPIAASDASSVAASLQPFGADPLGLELELDPVTPGQDDGRGDARAQEMNTKLDLAAAYEEIGDREGARELLDEVLREGAGDQQQRARELLARLG